MFDPADQSTGHNAGFVVIDARAIAEPADYDRKLKKLIDEIHAAPTAEGVERVLLPGEREWAHYRRAMEEGVKLPDDVCQKLDEACKLTGVSFGF
jgi:ureidoglycolate dehydrogenase (NAD+)